MEKETNSPNALWGHETSIEITQDGTYVEGHVHHTRGTTEEEVKEAVALVYGQDPSEVDIRPLASNNNQSNRRSFGFSNWGGSKWVPNGPQGNPENN